MKGTPGKITIVLVLHLTLVGFSPPVRAAESPNQQDGACTTIPNGDEICCPTGATPALDGDEFALACVKGHYPHGPRLHWNTEGTIVSQEQFKNGVLHGPFEERYDDGTLKTQGEYFYGQKSGEWNAFGRDGVKLVSGRYYQGLQTGIWTWWNENGTFSGETRFRGGNAQVSLTDRDGRLKTTSRYLDGQLHGAQTDYRRDGTIRVVRRYWKGKLHGETTRFHRDGDKVVTVRYRQGRRIQTTWWNRDGSVNQVVNEQRQDNRGSKHP